MIFRHVPYFTVERRWLPLGAPKLNLLRIGGLELSRNAGSGHGVVVAVVVLAELMLTTSIRGVLARLILEESSEGSSRLRRLMSRGLTKQALRYIKNG
jgi:hypothetical protein